MPTAALMPVCTAATATTTTTAATMAATASPPATKVLRAGAPAAAAVAPMAGTATHPTLPRPMVTLGRRQRRGRGWWPCIRHLQSNSQQVVVDVLPCRLALPLVLRVLALALWAALWAMAQ